MKSKAHAGRSNGTTSNGNGKSHGREGNGASTKSARQTAETLDGQPRIDELLRPQTHRGHGHRGQSEQLDRTTLLEALTALKKRNFSVRLPRDLGSTVPGNGLGLYLCRELTESMGGRIWVESRGVAGEGSAFHLRLPLPPPAPGERSRATTQPPAPAMARVRGR